MIGFRVGMFTAFYQLLTGDRQAARDTVKQTFENVRNLMMTFIQPILTRFQTAISAARTAVSTSFTNTRNAISTFFSNTWTKIQNAAKNAVEWIRDFFNGGGKEMLTSAFNNMLDGFVNIAKSILNTVIGFFE